MIYVMPDNIIKPSSTSLVAREIERQSGQQLERLLQHNEFVQVGFLDKEGRLTIRFYKADDWFGMIELNLVKESDYYPKTEEA